jgi:hypothetical protein
MLICTSGYMADNHDWVPPGADAGVHWFPVMWKSGHLPTLPGTNVYNANSHDGKADCAIFYKCPEAMFRHEDSQVHGYWNFLQQLFLQQALEQHQQARVGLRWFLFVSGHGQAQR